MRSKVCLINDHKDVPTYNWKFDLFEGNFSCDIYIYIYNIEILAFHLERMHVCIAAAQDQRKKRRRYTKHYSTFYAQT